MAAKVDLNTSTDWKEAKSFLKGLSDKQREEHYFCQDFIRLKKVPTWKETAKGLTVKVEEPKYKKDKHLNEKISLFRGDITKLEVDAIVNAEHLPGGLAASPPAQRRECWDRLAMSARAAGKACGSCATLSHPATLCHRLEPLPREENHSHSSESLADSIRVCFPSPLKIRT
ncbi:PREDICTED: O-acetyl-ADP-ribose deacetylase MACROD1 isoform X1 [Myotis davidii]|uniref:O-acetyl-ADP-ribose deacetylase MACROD1 isoform X1 n=1 Tax=Myotis davidii TaxID=225400 RepID=UPI0003EBE92A|nr:PREDICTED: O-acetyl-ADP-ribose deacetylase MACROD1 isoform X1 [Myotis davidii]